MPRPTVRRARRHVRPLGVADSRAAGYLWRECGGGARRTDVRALLDAHIKVFFVTHRFGFAERFHREHAPFTLFLRAERLSDGRRNYKLAVKDPLPTSYGEDLYYRLGGWLDENKTLIPAASPDGEQWAWTLPVGPQAPAHRQDERDRG